MHAGRVRLRWLTVVAAGLVLWASPAGGDQGDASTAPPEVSERDQRIHDMLFLRLVASPTLAAYGIEVDVERGVVALSGAVPTADAADRALRIAAWTPGVQDVCADLRIDPTVARNRGEPEPLDPGAREVS